MDLFLFLFVFLFLLPFSHPTCNITTDHDLLTLAFSSVSNFQLPDFCSEIQELKLPSKNLSGTVSWLFLSNISTLSILDLSNNSLQGSIPSTFWSSPSFLHINLASNHLGGTLRFDPGGKLESLNLSSNRFTNTVGMSGLTSLNSLDVSRNNLTSMPVGLDKLRGLRYLDVSHNSMEGTFPRDFFPLLSELHFLNVSFNNLTGKVDSKNLKKFGRSAFIRAGSQLSFTSHSSGEKKHKRTSTGRSGTSVNKLAVIVAVSVTIGLVLLVAVLLLLRRRNYKRKNGWKEEERAVAAATEEVGWVAKANWTARVVVFEKPLLQLTFEDLAAATSGFGKECQLAEGGRSGAAYRAVLAGDLHVVIRVVDSVRGVEEREVAVALREIGSFRHPNLLPLLGYCIAGREKLLLYEYMEKGNLHQWLHELPASHPNMEERSEEPWEPHHNEEKRVSPAAKDWPTRHRIALGIARGLAFLHQGWVGSRQSVIHGHLVPSNILLDDDLEPRIADFLASGSIDEGVTIEGDVYSYGVLLIELVTGRARWSVEEVNRVRKLVREGRATEVVDSSLQIEEEGGLVWAKEMVDSLGIGYLCTAPLPEKRPTMQQVVGLLKDIRSSTTTASDVATTSSAY